MSQRNPALDGIRGLAVLLVLMFHTTHMGHASPVEEFVWRITRGMNCGVEIFFALSGFLITGILIDAKGSPDYFRNFYARRTLRIFPLYYAVVTLCVVAPYLVPSSLALPKVPNGGAPYWLYLSNVWTTGPHPVLGVAWSLAVEEQFYLLWPMVVFLLGAKGLTRVCIVNIFLALGYRIAVSYGGRTWPPQAPLAYLDLLSMGALLAIRCREMSASSAVLAAKRAAIAGAVLLVVVVSLEQGFWGNARNTIGITAVGLLAAGAILGVAIPGDATPPGRLFGTKVLQTFGKYSYAIYLLHSPLDSVVRRTIFRADPTFAFLAEHQLAAQVLYWIVMAGLSLGLGWVSWQLFEKHFINLKRLFPRRDEREPELLPATAASARKNKRGYEDTRRFLTRV